MFHDLVAQRVWETELNEGEGLFAFVRAALSGRSGEVWQWVTLITKTSEDGGPPEMFVDLRALQPALYEAVNLTGRKPGPEECTDPVRASPYPIAEGRVGTDEQARRPASEQLRPRVSSNEGLLCPVLKTS